MRLLNKLTISSLRLNRKRTAVTVVGIILAAALLTAVSSMAVTFQKGIVAREKYSTGDYHYAFFDRTEEQAQMIRENRQVESTFATAGIGYAKLDGSINPDKPYLYLMAMDAEGFANSSVHLTEGRFPVREGEILISKHIQTNGGVSYHVGDVLTLTVGRRVSVPDHYDLGQSNPYTQEETILPEYTKEYTVVGVTERLHKTTEPWTAPGYTVLTCWDERKNSVVDSGKETLYVRYTPAAIKNRLQITEDILGIDRGILQKFSDGTISEEEKERWFGQGSPDTYFYENSYLIRYESLDFSESVLRVVYVVAAIVLVVIVFTSVFCIHNSFAISITEKMRQYGMLSSVGATPRQIRKNVYYEAFLLAAVGVPLGILSGLAACAIVTEIVSGMMEELMGMPLRFEFSLPAIFLAAVLSLITIFLSARKPAKAASKVAPVPAVLGISESREDLRREIKTPAYVHRLFGMGGVIAHKNMKRTGKRYRVVAASIAVSVTVFVAMYSFIDLAMRTTTYYLADGYNLSWNMQNIAADIPVAETAAAEGAESWSIQRVCYFKMLIQNINYSDKYRKRYFAGDVEGETWFNLHSLGDEEYKRYLKKVGLSYEDAKDQLILVNQCLDYDMENGKYEKLQIYDYKAGDQINGVCEKIPQWGESTGTEGEGTQEVSVTLTIAAVTDQVPMGFSSRSISDGLLIVSDAWMDAHADIVQPDGTAYFDTQDPDAFQKLLNEEYQVSTGSITNVAQQERENRSLYTIVAIFLYGFITVISLIGVTNIFNTITTSMELRSKEFAMLRSVGMTEREFRRMVRLESLFYGSRALILGLAAGTALSWIIYDRISEGVDVGYRFPFPAMAISAGAVALLLLAIMQFSLKKICSQNIIETIRRDNI